MYHQLSRSLKILVTAILLSVSTLAFSSNNMYAEETPSMMAMTGDALIVRPLMLLTTVGGTAIFLVSLPFSALGGNTGEAADVLVAGPARTTFLRCLGCAQGRRNYVALEN